MPQVTLPYTLVGNTDEDVNQLMADLIALRDGVNNVDGSQIVNGTVGLVELDPVIAQLIWPIGALMDYAGQGDLVSNKIILADGRALSRAVFSTLYNSMGTVYGVGDGVNTFNIPDLRGRVAVGPNNMGTAQGNVGRLTTYVNRGEAGGFSTVGLATGHLPAHAHPITDVAHAHLQDSFSMGIPGHGGTAYNAGGTGQSGSTGITPMTYGAFATDARGTGINGTNNTGSNVAHENMPPYQVVNKLIRIA